MSCAAARSPSPLRIAVSAAARHFIQRYFPGDYKVIPNGVDLRQFEEVTPFARWRDGIPNILFLGRFENRKGLMYLLRAYYQLRVEGLPCRLLLVGNGPQAGEAKRYIKPISDVSLSNILFIFNGF